MAMASSSMSDTATTTTNNKKQQQQQPQQQKTVTRKQQKRQSSNSAAASATESASAGEEEDADANDNSVEYPTYDKGANVDGVQTLVRAKDVNEKDFDSEEVAGVGKSALVGDVGASPLLSSNPGGPGLTDEELFEDAAAYNSAPIVQVLPESPSMKYRMIVLQHERYYRSHPSRLYVPRLRKTAKLTIEEFANRFIKTSQPVIIPFEAMRHLGFNSQSWTLDELLEKYPNYKRPLIYKYGAPGPGEMDLGPAIWCLKQGTPLKKTGTGRNFPRNTKVSLDKISKLGAQYPPYILPGTGMLLPSLWFATSHLLHQIPLRLLRQLRHDDLRHEAMDHRAPERGAHTQAGVHGRVVLGQGARAPGRARHEPQGDRAARSAPDFHLRSEAQRDVVSSHGLVPPRRERRADHHGE